MIAYFDTSAIVPLLIDETGSQTAGDIWDRADRLVSVRLAHVETRAALSQAARLRRISPPHLRSSVRELEDLFDQIDIIDVDEDLIREAGDLAEDEGLRAHDAVHPSRRRAAFPTSTSSSWPAIGRYSPPQTLSACP